MMRKLFLTISIVIVSRTLIIILWKPENDENMDQVVTMAGFLLSIVLILTLSWSIRDSVNKMREHDENLQMI